MNRINIDLDRVLSDIDRNVFGGYMEFGYQDAKFEYLNVGDDNSGLRSDVKAVLERMKLANIRFPGGNFASQYHWRDGIGPREKVRHATTWLGTAR